MKPSSPGKGSGIGMIAGAGLAAALAGGGCSRATDDSAPVVDSLLEAGPTRSAEPEDVTSSPRLSHQFGALSSRVPAFSHRYRLTNPSPRPVKIVGVTPSTPCCTAVESRPEGIPAGGSAEVVVRFRPNDDVGSKRFLFLVETDDVENPVKTLVLEGTVFAAWEVIPAPDGSGRSLDLGQEGRRTFRLISRSKAGSEGRALPQSLGIPPPLVAVFAGPVTRDETSAGVVETSRAVEVTIPASSEAGSRRSSLTLLWADGQSDRVAIDWTVNLPLRAAPAGLTVGAEDATTSRDIIVSSNGGAFRVTGVSGPLLAEPVLLSTEPASVQRLRLLLDPKKSRDATVSDLRIETDHAGQPSLTISVLILPRRGVER